MAAAVLAGADVACAQSAAAPGSLAPPGKYVAWISSAAANARDRLKAAAGGVMPRGWVRLDGRPFLDELPAATADQYVVPATLYPVKFDEKGAVTFNWTFTATDTRGLFTPGFSCLNWTDRSSPPTTTYAWAGHPDAGVSVWTMWYATYCSTRNSLYCMQVDHANPIPPQQAPLNAKRVFVSRYATPGAGLAGADASCSAAAAAAGLTGVFKALIAPTGASAASRFHPDGGRAFVRTDGVVVSATDTALFAGAFGTILAPIVVDARGAYTDGTVFTGAANVGDAGSLNCGNWTTASSASTTYAAFACFSGARVFQGTLTRSCDSADSIFCVQD